MKRLWYAFRCRVLNQHRWRELHVDEEQALECRDCGKRAFGDPDEKRNIGGLGWPTGV